MPITHAAAVLLQYLFCRDRTLTQNQIVPTENCKLYDIVIYCMCLAVQGTAYLPSLGRSRRHAVHRFSLAPSPAGATSMKAAAIWS